MIINKYALHLCVTSHSWISKEGKYCITRPILQMEKLRHREQCIKSVALPGREHRSPDVLCPIFWATRLLYNHNFKSAFDMYCVVKGKMHQQLVVVVLPAISFVTLTCLRMALLGNHHLPYPKGNSVNDSFDL